MTARTETKTLIARQIAIFNGGNWDAMVRASAKGGKQMTLHLTLAENILATVERKMIAEVNGNGELNIKRWIGSWDDTRNHSPGCATRDDPNAQCDCYFR
jgi:hypothetical protein